MGKFIGALDQGTTSTRFIVFDHGGRIAGLDQKEHDQIFPQPGWVEHDPMEIWVNTQKVIRGGLAKAGNREIDFIAEKEKKRIYLQVAYMLHSHKIIDREFSV
jgi:glycerol kinase